MRFFPLCLATSALRPDAFWCYGHKGEDPIKKALAECISSEKARRQVFHAAAAVANKTPGAQVSENLKKQTPSRSNPIQN
ncbi:hypothetical protein HU200_025894 [Digitaria exilis]|uniref:Uncharacterized protein n=1 Tax=Digitaria exilis TaxID=1010633 RepID=A0A835C7P1_9POAL|nr:hypothetical protein HU200_025894 [Digitaria exilis]